MAELMDRAAATTLALQGVVLFVTAAGLAVWGAASALRGEWLPAVIAAIAAPSLSVRFWLWNHRRVRR